MEISSRNALAVLTVCALKTQAVFLSENDTQSSTQKTIMIRPTLLQILSYAAISSILFLHHSPVSAQSTGWCAADSRFRERLQQDTVYARRYAHIEKNLKEKQNTLWKGPQARVTIPVVVHVVHNGDSLGVDENIPDSQILSQIEALNLHFQKQDVNISQVPAVFQPLIADFEMEFCLAARDPQGFPTSGIQRINGGRNIWNITQADQFKPSTIWDPKRYLNIWVMRLGGTSSGTLGYATFPWDADSINGIVIDYKAFGTTGNLLAGHEGGKTTTHEVGHWLGLFHIWGDDNGACNQDDQVPDTPVQASENYGCPEFPHISCNNGPNGDMFMNYMDYTDDACSAMFTTGQKTRASLLLQSLRSSILSSDGCVPTTVNARDVAITRLIYPTADICVENVVPTIEVWNIGGSPASSITFSYQIDGGPLKQYEWNGWIPSLSRQIIQLPVQNLAFGMHEIVIFVSGVNGSNDQNATNDGAEITFNISSIGIGNPIPTAEPFESGGLPVLWDIQNSDGDRTWAYISSIGYGGSNGSMVFDNFINTGTNPTGKRDGLITPEYDFRTSLYPYLTFKVAYAQRISNSTDSLIVYYSLDCGYSWTRIYASGGAALATAPPQTQAFIPQQNEWREDWAPVMHLAAHYKVKFKFENYSQYGNRLYLDDIRVELSVTGAPTLSSADVRIYPNPSRETVQIELARENFNRIQLIDISGNVCREVVLTSSGKSPFTLDIRDLPGGFYLLKLAGNQSVTIRKICIL
ncbi:MAG: hypothetical protein KatS3mg031_2704 [Chitinophagales bacterium]|nr:MAG: hypothetical protein KatS3mg031_2704 [Chitinophagales bacterium]